MKRMVETLNIWSLGPAYFVSSRHFHKPINLLTQRITSGMQEAFPIHVFSSKLNLKITTNKMKKSDTAVFSLYT